MKKRFWGFAALSILLVIGALCAVCLHIRFSQQENQNVQLPEEVSALIESYMAAYQIGTEKSVEYMHFEDDFIRSVYMASGDRLIAYEMESAEKINDKLYALTILVKTNSTVFHFGDEYQRIYNFVAQIDGEWFYLNGVTNIPSDLQDNLTAENYGYNDDNIVDQDDVLGEIM